MINDYKNVPCVVKHKGVYYKTPKAASFFSKHREMNNDDTEIFYIDESINERALIDKALGELEKTLKGEPIKQKEIFEGQRPYTHVYRLNVNTTLCAYSEEDLNRLKESYNVK